MEQKKRILFLYMEMAEYFLSSIENTLTDDLDIHIVHLEKKSEAPFQFRQLEEVHFYSRPAYSNAELTKLVDDIDPHAIFCAGWIDKGYNQICRAYLNKIPTILLLDNQWTGGMKQRVAKLISPFLVRNKFSHIWVSGEPQRTYAHKLGYSDDQIKSGYYCADTSLFVAIRQRFEAEKKKRFPKKFLFVGRYMDFKGIHDLWEAFKEANQDGSWELICAGTGELWDERDQSEHIKHLGFVQPADFDGVIKECGVFVLPSHFEPWGVVVHEMAAAGMPIICSDKVGASTMFVEDQKNGWVFKGGDAQDLHDKLRLVMNSSEDQLQQMGLASAEIAGTLTSDDWTRTLREFL